MLLLNICAPFKCFATYKLCVPSSLQYAMQLFCRDGENDEAKKRMKVARKKLSATLKNMSTHFVPLTQEQRTAESSCLYRVVNCDGNDGERERQMERGKDLQGR